MNVGRRLKYMQTQDVELMLVHRLRRWTNAKPTLNKRLVSAGIYVYDVGLYHLVYVAGYANILIKIKQNKTNNKILLFFK